MVTLQFKDLTFPTFKEKSQISDDIARIINPAINMIGFIPYPQQSNDLGEAWIVTKGKLWEIFFHKEDPSTVDILRLTCDTDLAKKEETALAEWLKVRYRCEGSN